MNRGFHLVTLVKQPRGIVFLELVVVLVGARPEFYFLDGNESLFSPGLFLLLFLFVLKFTEVNDATNGRLSLRRDFDKVEPLAARDFDRLLRRHDAELVPVVINHADLTNSYPFVHSDRRPAVTPVPESSSRLKAANTVSS